MCVLPGDKCPTGMKGPIDASRMAQIPEPLSGPDKVLPLMELD